MFSKRHPGRSPAPGGRTTVTKPPPRLHRLPTHGTRPVIRTRQLRHEAVFPDGRLKFRAPARALDAGRHRRHTLLKVQTSFPGCAQHTPGPWHAPPNLKVI